ncbi:MULTISPECIES: hypothetical protein [unclassified Pedobacter]|uniref:hypothetical protein n=1 Tax=Pedobacter TaxID=84567 RepID=UPI000B4B81CE|nr:MULTISPECIES: hypothetical protein [unclassified Pedobacter]MCX2432998.1 hypothetical protein [Pedobacter sp. GR22-10]MCX2586427.1 hypothetical protein [Pedobacter sp. MR22-3]OWK72177.1 hypothetical protein CBW18_00935 [Pedobacter sp. AJM]
MTFIEFKDSLKSDHPPIGLSVPLKALWFDGKGDWDQAHHEVDHLDDAISALIHAYLHRKEGDTWNADYWYRNAKESRPQISLEEEWEQLVVRFL